MTSFYEILIIGLVLSADSFSAAVAMGHRPFSKKDAYGFAISSGVAEALMAMLGAFAGSYVISKFSAIDHWVAFGLLGGVALHMGYEGIHDLLNKTVKVQKLNFHSFKKVLLISFATSLDAFGVGIGLGVAKKPILPFILSIGLWACITTILGLHLARKLSQNFAPFMNLLGALVLGYMAIQSLKI